MDKPRTGAAVYTISMLSGFFVSQAADWQLALHLLQEVHASGVESNVISYNASISACEKNGLWQLSLVLLEEALQSQLEVTAVSFSAAIGACERAVVMQRAKAKGDDQKVMMDG